MEMDVIFTTFAYITILLLRPEYTKLLDPPNCTVKRNLYHAACSFSRIYTVSPHDFLDSTKEGLMLKI